MFSTCKWSDLTAKTSAFIEVLPLTDDQLIDCIRLVTHGLALSSFQTGFLLSILVLQHKHYFCGVLVHILVYEKNTDSVEMRAYTSDLIIEPIKAFLEHDATLFGIF